MQKPTLILTLSSAFFLLAMCWGCSKNNSSSSSSTNADSLIIQAAWKYDTSGVDLDEDGKIDHSDIPDTVLKPCQKDNIFSFYRNGTGLIDEGATKCSAGDAQTDAMTWDFTNNDKVLNVTSATVLNGNLNVLNLTATNMVLYKDTTVLGVSFRYLIALKH